MATRDAERPPGTQPDPVGQSGPAQPEPEAAFAVRVSGLRAEAAAWAEQSAEFRRMSTMLDAATVDDRPLGPFEEFARRYERERDRVARLLGEGSAAMSAMSDTLTRIAGQHTQLDDEIAQSYRDLMAGRDGW
jgi:hypothetical protein